MQRHCNPTRDPDVCVVAGRDDGGLRGSARGRNGTATRIAVGDACAPPVAMTAVCADLRERQLRIVMTYRVTSPAGSLDESPADVSHARSGAVRPLASAANGAKVRVLVEVPIASLQEADSPRLGGL